MHIFSSYVCMRGDLQLVQVLRNVKQFSADKIVIDVLAVIVRPEGRAVSVLLPSLKKVQHRRPFQK